MLSPEARPYIDASVPVLREHGLTITRIFYANLFREFPELTNLFNMGNQASGVQQQSLASAVFAYAANIDNAAALGPVVSRIVNKHASVGIKAEHYPIVGRHLLGAIQQTLGEAATPPLLQAWDEAYTLLANALIAQEKELYAQAGIEPGALQAMRVTHVEKESGDVISITLQPMEGETAPAFKPGQYISLSVDLGGGRRQLRQYSLSDAPNPDYLRISVKKEAGYAASPAGEVSNWLHRNVQCNSILQVSPPFGDFTPDTESGRPIVLLSAGVGITPMISVLNHIAQVKPQRTVVFGFASRDSQHHPHQTDIASAHSRMPNLQTAYFYEALSAEPAAQTEVHAGHMRVHQLPEWDKQNTNVYICGPLGFMQAQWRALAEAGVPVAKLHREVFGPDLLDHIL